MKKLMLAVALICTAIIGRAAAVSWSSGSVRIVDPKTGDTLTSLSSGSIWLVVLSDKTGWSEGTWSAAKGSVTELASANIGAGKTAGIVAGTRYSFTYDETGATGLKNGDVLAVVFKDSSGAYDQLEYYSSKSAVTDTLTVSGMSDTTWSQTFAFGQDGGSITTPVPEPTSAILVLLGFAGLALKRKRA